VTAAIDYASIAWPGLLTLAGFVALIIHAHRDYRRRHPQGRYRRAADVRTDRLVDAAAQPCRDCEAGEPHMCAGWIDAAAVPDATTSAHARGLHRGVHADPDCYHCATRDAGRALASRRDDLIAHGADPRELLIPLAPYEGDREP
jgi:hypothetical protein